MSERQAVTLYTAKTHGREESEALLRRSVEDWLRRKGRPAADLSVTRPLYQKPFFTHAPEICFSVSHSGTCWICAISDREVGVDLQEHKGEMLKQIARRHFHALEQAWLEKHPEDFFRVWTAKESYVKFTGQGIDDTFDRFSAVDEQGFCAALQGSALRHIPFCEGYSLCLCTAAPADWEMLHLDE